MLCNLTYGVAADGSALHISKAQRGESCGCTCPGCGEPLVARKGDKTEHHFAHISGCDCPHGFTNSLYYGLHDAVQRVGYIALPSYIKNSSLKRGSETVEHIRELIPPTRVKVERVEFSRKGGQQITGLLLYCSGKPLFLRILAGFSEPRSSMERIKLIGLPVVEIDLTEDDTLTDDLAREYICSRSKQKYWIYNKRAEDVWEKAIDLCTKLDVKGKGMEIFTYGCPSPRMRGGAECFIMKSCAECPFFYGMFGILEDRYVLCGREAMLPDPRDAVLTYEERRAKYSRKRAK